jgi:hypothetical protein
MGSQQQMMSMMRSMMTMMGAQSGMMSADVEGRIASLKTTLKNHGCAGAAVEPLRRCATRSSKINECDV